jgi:hypothetical protein
MDQLSNGELDLLGDQHHLSRSCLRRGEEAWLGVDKDSMKLLPVLNITWIRIKNAAHMS